MFKWIFIILIIALSVLLFGREYIPEKWLESGYVDAAYDVLFPAQEHVNDILPLKNRHENKALPLDKAKLGSLVSSLKKSKDKAVILFYEVDSLNSRLALRKINEIAGKPENKNFAFLLVAFEDDPKKLELLLNNYQQINFKPFVSGLPLKKELEYIFIKNGIKITKLPSVLYGSSTGLFVEIPYNYDFENRLSFLINK